MLKFPKQILVDIENHLLEEKQKLEAEIADLTKQDPFADTDRLNDNAASDTDAKEEFNHDRYEAMLKELKTYLSEIEAALTRIKKGTYGFCIKCKQMIDTDRLAVRPTAQLCIKCEGEKKKR